MRISCVGLVVVGCLCALGAGAEDNWRARGEAARRELLEGVERIDTAGLPGPIVCLTEKAFPVIAGKNNDSTLHPICAGSFYGKGRVLVLGHPGFLVSVPYRADTERFLRNAFRWLAPGEGRTVAVWENEACTRAMEALGYTVTTVTSMAEAKKHSVVVFCVNKNPDSETPELLRYVEEGGSVLYTALAWGWKWYVSQSGGAMSLSQNFPDEHFLAPVGLLACDRSMGSTTGEKGFSSATELPYGSALPEALEAVRDASRMANDTVRKQVAKTLMQVADAYPPDESELFRALMALAEMPEAQKAPSPKAPVEESDFLARMGMTLRKNAWQMDPVRLWPADPAAAVYPGVPSADAARVKGAKTEVELSLRRWHSTGLFAGAGEPITVEVGSGVEALGLRLRVGTTSDDITAAQNRFVRAPLVTVSIPLDRREVTFSTPFGGLLYVDVPESIPTREGKAEVTISGAVRAPWFKLGRDRAEDFLGDLQRGDAPQFEIEGERFIVTAQCANNRALTNPEWIARVWDQVVELDEYLAAIPAARTYKQRFCYDEQLTSGLLHDGYPMMAYINHEAVDEVLHEEQLKKVGAWGVLHELGHNHQSGDWTFEGTTEVTVNLFTLYTTEKVFGIPVREAKNETRVADAKRRVLRWVEDGRDPQVWKRDPFLALETFTRMREAFGWELYERLFRDYRDPERGPLPTNDQEKRDQWVTRLSRLYKANFAEYFGAWAIPISEEAQAECARHPSLRETHPELFAWLELPTYEGAIPLTVVPRGGAIENGGNYACFTATVEAESYQRVLFEGIRSGRFQLEVGLTDEAEGRQVRFAYPISDMNKDARDPVLNIASGRVGVTPRLDRAYTLEFWVREGEELRYQGCSEKGAFRSTDPRFLSDGPNAFAIRGERVAEPTVLTGKNILFVGDSITEAICEVNSPELHYTAGWPGRIGWKHGMRWVNAGISGARLTHVWGPGNTIHNQLKWNQAPYFDFVLLHGGINDAMGKAPVGVITPGGMDDYNPEAETFETFAGSLEYTFWLARKLYPKATKGYLINFKVAPSGWSDWEMFPQYLPVAKAICAKWGIPYLNLWENESVTAQMRPETCTAMGDSLHPNDRGYDILAPYVEQFLLALAEGKVAAGEEFVPEPVLWNDPLAVAMQEGESNVAAGKPAMCKNSHEIVRGLTDGNRIEKVRLHKRSTRFEDLAESPCYAEIDLQALYTLSKIRVFGKPVNAVLHWAAYATEDPQRPLSEWVFLGRPLQPRMSTDDGVTLAFPPVDAKYVRLYGYTKTAPYRQEFSEVEVFGTLSPRNTHPLKPVEIDAQATNLALGCPVVSGADPNARKMPVNDGRTVGAAVSLGHWRPSPFESAYGLEGPCYVELDLGKVCAIDALRASFHDNDTIRWRAFVTDDATRPVAEWTPVGGKESLSSGVEGTAIAFPETTARFVRVYGLGSIHSELVLSELEVYGRETDAPLPAPRHTAAAAWESRGERHGHPCTDPGCTELVQPMRHVWGPLTLTRRAERDQPGQTTRECAYCRAVETNETANIALGKPAFRGDTDPKTPYPYATNGNALEILSPRKQAVAHPSAEVSEASRCYVEVDLEGRYALTSATVVTYLEPIRDHFAVYVTDDPTKDISEWTLVGKKCTPEEATRQGVTFSFANPIQGSVVRVYGLSENLLVTELSLLGTYVGPASTSKANP